MASTVALHTFGCKVNQYETEELRGQLALGGYRVVAFDTRADVYLINSCTVTADADRSCRQMVRKLLREKSASRIVVTGCYAERAAAELRELSPRVEVFGNGEKPVLAVALGVPTACIQDAADRGGTSLGERTRAYLKVQDGCDAHCTYCIIPSVRPQMVSRLPESVLKEAASLIDRGFKEIVLTGVRLGRYNQSGWDLTRLIQALVAIPGEFRIRLSSIEVTETPDALVDLAAGEGKLCPFFHIPLQSGSDSVLKRMGRWYSAREYRQRIQWIRSRIPDAAFSADVIVGFAGEEESDFQKTVELVRNEAFSRLHAFRYSIRPGTPAERLKDQIDPRLKSRRVRDLVHLDRQLRAAFAARFLHRPIRVLVESHGTGYSDHYVRVQMSPGSPDGTFQRLIPTRSTDDGSLAL